MTLYTIEAKIAVGANNVAGLALVTSLTAGSIPFEEVQTPARYSRGEKRMKANGRADYTGFSAKQWTSSLLWLPQWELLASTYQRDVTIRTWLGGVTYANYSALLDFDELDEFEPIPTVEYGWAIPNFTWRFTDLVLIP